MATSEEIYEALKSAVELAGVEYVRRILYNEQTPRTSRMRSFFLLSEGWIIAEGMRAQVGYKWVTESYIVRLSHGFRGKRQDSSRALAYSDAIAVQEIIDTNAGILGISGSVEVTSQIGPALSASGDFILTDLSVAVTYMRALPPIS